jgi:hypothetical protein
MEGRKKCECDSVSCEKKKQCECGSGSHDKKLSAFSENQSLIIVVYHKYFSVF